MNTNTMELNLDEMEMVTGGDFLEDIVVERVGGFALGAAAGTFAGMGVGAVVGGPIVSVAAGPVGFVAGGVAGAIVGTKNICHAIGNGAGYVYDKFKDLVDWIG